jgi:amidase
MQSREVTSRQLVDTYLARIGQYDQQGPALNAIKAVTPRARERKLSMTLRHRG